MFKSEIEKSLNTYKSTKVNANINVADPYIITKMLFQGVFERLAEAKGAIERNDLETKAKKLSSAADIIKHLQSTLDFSQSKEIAQNLFDIYDYMLSCIADAAVQVNNEPIDNALNAFLPIKQAWDNIPIESQKEANLKREKGYFEKEFTNDTSLAHGTIR